MCTVNESDTRQDAGVMMCRCVKQLSLESSQQCLVQQKADGYGKQNKHAFNGLFPEQPE